MKGKKEIVGNMNDILSLDAMEARKRLNKKAVKQCIMEAYCYVMALYDRIDTGDLYGGLVELTPEQMKSSYGIDVTPETTSENNEEEGSEADLQNDSNSDALANPEARANTSESDSSSPSNSGDLGSDDDDILPEGNPF